MRIVKFRIDFINSFLIKHPFWDNIQQIFFRLVLTNATFICVLGWFGKIDTNYSQAYTFMKCCFSFGRLFILLLHRIRFPADVYLHLVRCLAYRPSIVCCICFTFLSNSEFVLVYNSTRIRPIDLYSQPTQSML